ncbi:hypothetical protein RF11_03369 [Thelohanellus kitauei]|uniref:BHLH domain-containing protein n=1 Tax=Thelohanellus kitauei TaxID=669202 RepID=A0A0C2JQE8_THEKT|nr:hypothetical protein RF11_03369 [Thelohanellus kitauei]
MDSSGESETADMLFGSRCPKQIKTSRVNKMNNRKANLWDLVNVMRICDPNFQSCNHIASMAPKHPPWYRNQPISPQKRTYQSRVHENFDPGPGSKYEYTNNSRVHHNQLEKQRRESMRSLFTEIREMLPNNLRSDRISTAKLLVAAAQYIKDNHAIVLKYVEKNENLYNQKISLLRQLEEYGIYNEYLNSESYRTQQKDPKTSKIEEQNNSVCQPMDVDEPRPDFE